MVTHATVSKEGDARLVIEGDMGFQDAVRLRDAGEKLIGELSDVIEIDLSRVGQVGSGGISVLLCWMRLAESMSKTLHFVNIPDFMMDVVRVSGVNTVIPHSA